MANRIIRTGFLDSEKINSLQDSEQVFFVRLMLIVDDYGHCDSRPIFIRSKCYPVTEVSVEKIERMLESLKNAGLIAYYIVDGKQYLEIPNFGQRLRSMRYTVPCPSSVSKVRPELEVEEEVEVFDRFWNAYPKKVSKQDAIKAWKKLKPPLDLVLKALEWQKVSKQWMSDGGQYIPNPATYLNAKKWEDQPLITGVQPAEKVFGARPWVDPFSPEGIERSRKEKELFNQRIKIKEYPVAQ